MNALTHSPYLHPFLAAAFPVLFLYAHNARIVAFANVWSTWAVAWAGTAVALVVLRGMHDAHRRALVVTWCVLLFASYGHAARHVPETLVGLGILVAGVAGVAWIRRLPAHRWTPIVNGVTAGLVVVQLLALGSLRARPDVVRPAPLPPASPAGARPDIYFIVLDGFARQDVLRDLYDYDNAAFVDSLRALGFQVLDRSRANYCQTILSVAATLNLDYVSRLVEMDPRSRDRRPMLQLIRDSRLMEALRAQGYSVTAFASGFEPTEIAGADRYLRPRWGLSEFQQIVVSTTPLSWLGRFGRSQYDLHRERLDFILGRLPETAARPGPKLVFAHLLAPHPPFVFGPEGEPLERARPFDFGDGSHYYDMGGTHEEYVRRYRDQLRYVSSRLLDVVGRILEGAPEPPVIVLQSDHGPGSELDWWTSTLLFARSMVTSEVWRK